jgi:hypothetical protein
MECLPRREDRRRADAQQFRSIGRPTDKTQGSPLLRGLSVIVSQPSTRTLATLNFAATSPVFFGRIDQAIVQPLVVAFAVQILDESNDQAAQNRFIEDD